MLYEHLKQFMPALGIVLDCCTQPSHDLGNEKHFTATFGEMRDSLLNNGIRNVIVACPSCHKVFRKYGKELIVRTAYEIMAEKRLPERGQIKGVVTVHDSCAVRFEGPVHTAARDLIRKMGLTIEEMKHSAAKTFCCGEGGSVGFLAPDLAKNWRMNRKKEADGRRVITYCAGCANRLSSVTPTSHLLDLLFEPEATMSGSVKVSKAPFTYWNRIRLKKRLKKMLIGSMVRERIFSTQDQIE
jgi:Fe-S oxidoreductase